jgi:NAD(P)-dependent dehydrogenase (short-subunit alcohol dehydrogenase family)
MDTVAGKKVMITGAAMGMGKIYAQLAVAEGAGAVVLWDINQAELDKTAAELKGQGGKVHPYVVDVSNKDAVVAAADRVKQQVGDIEVLFNNAGIVRGKYFWEHSDADIWLTMAINALAPMYIARAFLPKMIASKTDCRIINIASAAGTVSNPRMSVYCSSKWAALGWSDSLRLELEKTGNTHIRVTTVCPGYISTGMFEGAKGPLLTPILTPQYVCERVWRAMKAGTPLLTMPWTVRLGMLARGLLPLAVWDWVAEHIFGVYKSMDEFKGRQPGVTS